MITLLDYGAGNVRSLINALEYLGETVAVVQHPEDIARAERLVFPGVGNYGALMRTLRKRDYVEPLLDYLRSDRPFFGICVALQALFESSEEADDEPGLGVLPGRVQRFTTTRAIPQIGWNSFKARQPSRLFAGMNGEEKFYFVHSYHVTCDDDSVVLATTDYGYEFVSAIQRGNIVATQFHPEKSGQAGLRMLKNFLELDRKPVLPATQLPKTKLAKRVIACLDVRSDDRGDLVVTKGDQYDVREEGQVRNLGKPVLLAGRYYEEGADEVTFLNITGFRDFPLHDMPMLRVLEETSKNVFVPLTIGGGIRDFTDCNGKHYTALEVAAEYFRAGADKISIGSDAVLTVEEVLKTGKPSGSSPIEQISKVYGNQAVVISVDPRRVYVKSPEETSHPVIETSNPGPAGENYCWYQCTIQGGRQGRDLDAVTLAKVCAELGAGEILLNCIDKDGSNSGFDLELIRAVKGAVAIPVIASSGAGSAAHFLEVFTETDVDAALAAGIFHREEVSIAEVKACLLGKVEIRNTGDNCFSTR